MTRAVRSSIVKVVELTLFKETASDLHLFNNINIRETNVPGQIITF